MKRWLSVFVVALLFVCGPWLAEAEAQRAPGGFGLGVGSTTHTSGVSMKQFAGPTALQATLGCWRGCDGLGGSVDLLVNMPEIAGADVMALAWNFGGGGALGLDSDGLGAMASFILGLELNFRVVPVDLVLEWRPGLQVAPDVDIALLGLGGHLRYYFGR